MASIPKPPTLTINVGDKMNLGGQQYTITNVAAGSDNNNGVISYAVTLNDTNSTVLNVSANNCVIDSPGTEASSTGVQVWKQTLKP